MISQVMIPNVPDEDVPNEDWANLKTVVLSAGEVAVEANEQ